MPVYFFHENKVPTKTRDFRKVLGVKASKDENLLKSNTVLLHYSSNKMVYPIHLAFSVDEVQSRNGSRNFGKRHWKKLNETTQNIPIA